MPRSTVSSSRSPLCAREARPLGLLSPVRTRVRSDDPATHAHHAGPEVRDRRVIGTIIDVEACRVVTVRARHVEAAHAEGAHVAQGHGLDRLVESATLDHYTPAAWLSYRLTCKRNGRLAGVAIVSAQSLMGARKRAVMDGLGTGTMFEQGLSRRVR
jgi:hypothetical protein